MSYYDSFQVWVRDLDKWINIDAINRYHEEEMREKERNAEFDKIGDIFLIGEKSIRSTLIRSSKLEPSEWRWAIHQAEMSLSVSASGPALEQELVRALIELGRAYAIARYAKWEKIPYSSALTVSVPLGFKALLNQYLIGQGLLKAPNSRERVLYALADKQGDDKSIAYNKVGIIQEMIHNLAYDVFGVHGPASLRRNATRTMLSLARLHYSVEELRLNNFSDVAKLLSNYANARKYTMLNEKEYITPGRHIRNWRLRHLRPLTDLFVYSIRGTLNRGINHNIYGVEIQREAAVNELALAHAEILLMGRREDGIIRR